MYWFRLANKMFAIIMNDQCNTKVGC